MNAVNDLLDPVIRAQLAILGLALGQLHFMECR